MRAVLTAVVSALLWALPAAGQAASDAAFLQQSAALRSKLVAWQSTLDKMNFAGSPRVNIRGETLEVRRGACRLSIRTVSWEARPRSEVPTVSIQLRILSEFSSFAYELDRFEHLLRLSREMESPGSAGSSVELEQVQQVEEMQKQFQESYRALSAETLAQLRALDQKRTAPQSALSREPGRIAGHVFNADNGQPLAGVTVALESSQSAGKERRQVTAADGSFRFADLIPGKYWVIASRSEFASSIYGMDDTQNVWASAVPLSPGQKLENADLQLSSLPGITAMNTPTSVASPSSEAPLMYGPGRFSPDGSEFAVAASGPESAYVCVYNMISHQPDYVATMPAMRNVNPSIRDVGWVGGSLYAWATRDVIVAVPLKISRDGMERLDVPPGCGNLAPGQPCIVSKDTLLPRMPPDVLAASSRVMSHAQGTQTNQHFVVTADDLPNQQVQLAAQRSDGGEPYLIATGGKELKTDLLDPVRSIVFYPVPGLYFGALAAINLDTRQSRRVALPFAQGLRLLDLHRDSERMVVAYTVDGPCIPQETPTGENPWILPNRPAPAAQAANVCFAAIKDIAGPSFK